jgi:hypothetical protein
MIGLVLVGLALAALAASPALAACCGGCPTVGPKGADGPTTAPADGKVVNARCPIMGGKLDRDNVPASLTRTFNGQKVGFCCGGCLPKWDKLSDEEKTAKLKAAME